MPDVMTQLHEEHRNIARLLETLERQLALFDTAEDPDYEVIEAIADYFASFPEQSHHPKEDLIYRKMCERDPSLVQAVTNLEAEHVKIGTLAGHFQEAVQNVLQEVEVSRSAFEEVANHFLRDQRRHLEMEEEQFFPLTLKTLTPEDWAEIDRQVTRHEDPIFGSDVAQKFEALRDAILEWEDEARKG